MPVKEAIILAGGLGTRLRSSVPDLPKCMAPVNGRPFIWYVINHLQTNGIEKFVFALGYRSEVFLDFLSNTLPESACKIVLEKEPLGTGGAIQFACNSADDGHVVVLNGDSIFKINIQEQADFHSSHEADCTLGLKHLTNFERYGSVFLNPDNTIASFQEKQFVSEGYINGGVYILDRKKFLAEGLPEKFSFETDYLQAFYNKRKIYGLPQDEYFIDIGIPEDYQRAQTEL